MPSPVAHSIIGLATGLAWLMPRGPLREVARAAWSRRWALGDCVVLANFPDVDYLPGILSGDLNACHHFYTHTPGWCLLVAIGMWCAMRCWRGADAATFGWILALLMSHLVADYVTEDTRPPIGIMALWPPDERFHISPVTLFGGWKKDQLGDLWQWYNFAAAAGEALRTVPLLAAVLVWKSLAKRSASPA